MAECPIYEPRGKAREYSELALNLYTGCAHACRYCYCPSIMRRTLEDWSSNPQPRKGILSALDNQASTMHGDHREVLLSFMSDPYQSEDSAKLTSHALDILARHMINVQVLTKNPARALATDAAALVRNRFKLATTVCFMSERLREEWEPGAPSIASRIEAIKSAHAMGIRTWVSVEPVVDPSSALDGIAALLGHVDFWKIGKMNHNKAIEQSVDWSAFLRDVESMLSGHQYMIKKDLEAFRS